MYNRCGKENADDDVKGTCIGLSCTFAVVISMVRGTIIFPIVEIKCSLCPNIHLFNILYLVNCIPWFSLRPRKRGRPYVSSPTIILRCFTVRIWFKWTQTTDCILFLTWTVSIIINYY